MSLYLTQGVRRAARLWPDAPAVAGDEGALSWSGFADRVARLASLLRELGCNAGDRVAYLGDNSIDLLTLYMAAPWGDLIKVPLNTRWAEAEMREALEDSGARVLIADAGFAATAERLKQAVPTVETLLVNGGAPSGGDGLSLPKRLEKAPPMPDALRGDRQTIALFYTGGTTGRAKGVMLSPATLVPTAMQVQMAAEITRDSVVMQAAPLFHMAAGGMSYAAFGAGAAQVLLPRFEPKAVLAAIEQHKVTHVLWVPTMLGMILEQPDLETYDLSSLQRIIYGAAPMPEALIRRAMAKIPSAGFVQVYGMTELSPLATVLGPDEHDPSGPNAHRLRSAGQPGQNVDLEIVDDKDAPVPPRTVGEIIVRSPGVMEGYWQQPELTAAAIRDGWMHTGDAGYLDEEGYLYVIDRIKDMIISGGENIYSAEVENALYKHPAVQECAVVGLPDPTWGEIVCAVVHGGGQDLTAEALIGHCQSLIAPFKCPKRVVFTDAPLPKTGAGKIQKTEIRKSLAETA